MTGHVNPIDFLMGFDSGLAVARVDAYRSGHVRGYELGMAAGRAAERADRDAVEAGARAELSRGIAAFAAAWTSADELADRRGQHERAGELRQLFRDRGLTVATYNVPRPTTPWCDDAMIRRCADSWDHEAVAAA